MKPVSIVLTINLTLFIVFFLFFFVILNRPEMIPLFTGFQTVINLLFVFVFLVDGRKPISMGFLVGFLLALAVSAVGFYLIALYGQDVQVEEMSTGIIQLKEIAGNS